MAASRRGGSPGVDAVVTALLLAASRCSVSVRGGDRTDPSPMRSVRAYGENQGKLGSHMTPRLPS